MEVECCGLEGLIRHPYASLSITGITQGFAKDELLSRVLLQLSPQQPWIVRLL